MLQNQKYILIIKQVVYSAFKWLACVQAIENERNETYVHTIRYVPNDVVFRFYVIPVCVLTNNKTMRIKTNKKRKTNNGIASAITGGNIR